MMANSSIVTVEKAGLAKQTMLYFTTLGKMSFGTSSAMVWRTFCADLNTDLDMRFISRITAPLTSQVFKVKLHTSHIWLKWWELNLQNNYSTTGHCSQTLDFLQ